MSHVMRITIVGLLSGLAGTGLGGFISLFFNQISNRTLGFILEFSAGLMTAMVCFELVPEALQAGGPVYSFTGIILGVISIILIENMLRQNKSFNKNRNSNLLKTGLLVAAGIALHNFPEGIAVGSGFEASPTLGMTITSAIIIHDIPEGIAMSIPMRAGGYSKKRAFLYTLLSGIPMGAGALAGSVLGAISTKLIAVCIGFAAGAMLYIIFGELVPESKKLYLGRFSSLGNVLGIICGIMISVVN